jgi:hypothetical protein
VRRVMKKNIRWRINRRCRIKKEERKEEENKKGEGEYNAGKKILKLIHYKKDKRSNLMPKKNKR